MEYGVEFLSPHSPGRLSGYFGAFVQNTQTMHDSAIWLPTLNCLRGQKEYLEELLSKTATTLNALRDRQTRNDRVLSSHPTPRSKRKKIQQNKYRTGKTIKTCENEERVILGCLQVCESNIQTLETIIHPVDISWTSAGQISSNSSVDSESTSLDWQGWTDDSPISPLKKDRRRSRHIDEVPPDTPVLNGNAEPGDKRPPPLPLRSKPTPSSAFLTAPPNSAYTNLTLSPDVVEFQPNINRRSNVQTGARLASELDKLTITGFLASKHMQSIQKHRFSEAATNHLFRRLSNNNVQSTLALAWTSSNPAHGDKTKKSAEKTRLLKRRSSV